MASICCQKPKIHEVSWFYKFYPVFVSCFFLKANEFLSNFQKNVHLDFIQRLQGWDYLEHRFEALKIKRQQCKDRIRAAEALRVAWLKIGKLGVLGLGFWWKYWMEMENEIVKVEEVFCEIIQLRMVNTNCETIISINCEYRF